MSQRRLPAEVYWRRRLMVLAALIALVWVVLQLVGGDDEDKAAPQPKAKAAATTSPTAAPTQEKKTNGLVDVALVTATAPCDPELVRITPTVRPDQRAGEPVEIGLVVSSTATTACTLKPADADAIAVITANGTAVWDSTVCKVSPLTKPVALSPGWATMTSVTWTGRGSGSRCTQNEGYATPGKYTVQIGTLGGEPGKTTFTLEARSTPKPAPKATKSTPTPKKSSATPSKATPKPPKGTTRPADD
ncbi:hypothetical protein GEV27_02450 [Aeromicrobium sp. S22]|uniref:hypothetical protein n=1 Tax=Aeromicrobium sp. S22 TaxID=2662029 RepID=UPI00129D4AC1|nr:hypothetical protein [Aeromicrobium sp. S22]MRK00374.1 hypothetical protein [Aeromicrobium sp. S22]